MEEQDQFAGANTATDKTIDIAEVLYPGLPVEKKFVLVTSMNLGYGKRRIPIYCLATGETSPVTSSSFGTEFHFTDDFKVHMTILDKSENVMLQDLDDTAHDDLVRIQEIRDAHFYQHSSAFESIRTWKGGSN